MTVYIREDLRSGGYYYDVQPDDATLSSTAPKGKTVPTVREAKLLARIQYGDLAFRSPKRSDECSPDIAFVAYKP
jgi:hypothetical protein